uniref:Endonuclease-reverse transcriptase n=1 Tax=Eumigus monticolus TaxID=1312893 RepID=A0A1B3B7F1_9ORTH|nr:hypothetical protein [Eumigus monticolus]
MTLRLRLNGNKHVTVVSAYAPTLGSDDDIKEKFYSDLDNILSNINRQDKIILLGDFNARVGKDYKVWNGVIGKEGVGSVNSNGIRLLSKCAEHGLVITNTIFRQKNRFKTSWQHPRSKHWHLIDYVIVRKEDLRDVLITKAMTGADDCWTDHRLIRSVMCISLSTQRRKQQKSCRRKFDTEKLDNSEYISQYRELLHQALPKEYPPDVTQHWKSLKATIQDSCRETLGYKTRKHQDWFDENDEEIEALISDKRKALQAWRKDINSRAKKEAFCIAKANVQRRTRALKNAWWTAKSKELQYLAGKDSRQFFQATKAIYGPTTFGRNPLWSNDKSTFLKDQNSIMNRWKEHFGDLLNQESVIDEQVYDILEQAPIQEELGSVPTLDEVQCAVNQARRHKATGCDGIPAEALKEGGEELIRHIHDLIVKIWKTEEMPADFRDSLIVPIFKKGDRTDCNNYRGISLLSCLGKLIARILANRILSLVEKILPESQCGFRPSRGTTDLIFTARQLQEKCREQNRPLYIAFIDLSKAFDSVNRAALWKILALYGFPPKFITILRLLYTDVTATVISNDAAGDPFHINTGVKQGCVIAPTLFSLYVATVMQLIKDDLPSGIQITYRMDGKLFNLSRLKARTRTSSAALVELQYADDNAVVAQSEEDLVKILNAFSSAYKKIGLKLNTNKTQILYQPAPGQGLRNINVTIDGVRLQEVNTFPYLGSILSSSANIDSEIQHRINCAGASFARLRSRVFDNRDLNVATKILVYNSVVVPTLLYGSETWTCYRRHLKKLEQYHQRCLRRILRVTWQDRRTNTSILEETQTTSVETVILRRQLRWTGHVIRMPNNRIPKKMFYSELTEGKRCVGGQRKRYRDVLKANMKMSHIDVNNWETLALDRPSWRSLVHQRAEYFEENRRRTAEDKRQRRKNRELVSSRGNNVDVPPGTTCQHCGKLCASRIGLHSHLRTHR